MDKLLYQEYLKKFVDGANIMINTPDCYSTSTIFGNELHVDRGKKFDLIRGECTNICVPQGYIFAKIDRESGHIYSQSGKKVRGSIFSEHYGLDCVTRQGVIVNANKKRNK